MARLLSDVQRSRRSVDDLRHGDSEKDLLKFLVFLKSQVVRIQRGKKSPRRSLADPLHEFAVQLHRGSWNTA